MRRFWLWLLAIGILAGSLRLGVLASAHPVGLTGDESYYLQTAFNLNKGFGYGLDEGSRAAWPPAHSYVLSHFVVPRKLLRKGRMEGGIRELQNVEVVLGTLLVVLTGVLGAAFFDRKTGVVSAGVAAFYPTFVAFSHSLWSETLFTLLLVAALSALVCAERRRSLALAVAAGLLFGVAGLTREVAILIAIASSGWLAVRVRHVAGPLLLLIAAAGVVLPWTWRNWQIFGRLVPVSTVGWMGVREGNTLSQGDWMRPDTAALATFRESYFAIPDELDRVGFARREALALIRAEQPGWIFKKAVRNTAMLFAPDSFLFKKISRGSYGDLPSETIRFLLVATAFFYGLVILAGVPGIAASGADGRRSLAVLVCAVVVVLHVCAQASSRYRFPLMPLLIVFASRAALHRRSLAAALSRPARIVCALVLAYFLAWCVPYFWSDAASLWSEGTYREAFRP